MHRTFGANTEQQPKTNTTIDPSSTDVNVKKSVSQDAVSNGANDDVDEESRHSRTHETQTPSEAGKVDDSEVDGEVRSIISQFGPAHLDSNGGPEGFKPAVSSPLKSETTVQKSRPLSTPDAPESPSINRATNLTPSLHHSGHPPEPEPELRFNFHLFLEQLRHRTADPVAKYLRSFLNEFGKKQWSVQEQVRIISDFLAFISGKMSQCDVWRGATEAEFDNAKEGMEKLVMNRLYGQTFSPEISATGLRTTQDRDRRKAQKQLTASRRGQHQEDVERDTVLAEKMQIFGWVEESHLDIAPLSGNGKKFLSLAQQELLKINNYRAPRDKVICILNACKVIFGLLRSSKSTDTSADSFMPLLIFTVLRAKPHHMVSNIQYIFRFRNQDKLNGEAGYYLSSLMGAVQFIENLDRTALTISDEAFEQHVEASVAAIAERRPDSDTTVKDGSLQPIESSARAKSRSPNRSLTGDASGPVQGILRNIQRPLSNLGRMFSDDSAELGSQSSASEQRLLNPSQPTADGQPVSVLAHDNQLSAEPSRRNVQHDVDVDSIVETLSSMFPTLDRDVISDIVIAKEARIGAAVDVCLNMSS